MGQYELTDIEEVSGFKSKGWGGIDMNDKGQVIGWNDDGHFYYDPETGVHIFPASKGTNGGPTPDALGDDGTVVGSDGPHYEGFTYRLGAAKIESLGPVFEPHGLNVSAAFDINAAGDIVGFAEGSGTVSGMGFLLTKDKHLINLSKAVDTKIWMAHSINDSGLVCGDYRSFEPPETWTSFVYNRSTKHLKVFHQENITQLTRPNGKNEVAGYQFVLPQGPVYGSFIYHEQTDKTTALPHGPVPTALDDQGIVVGYGNPPYGLILDRAASGAPGWEDINLFTGALLHLVTYPITINSSGQILCNAETINEKGETVGRVVILTPKAGSQPSGGKSTMSLSQIVSHLWSSVQAGDTSPDRLTRDAARSVAELLGTSEGSPDTERLAAQLVAKAVAARPPTLRAVRRRLRGGGPKLRHLSSGRPEG